MRNGFVIAGALCLLGMLALYDVYFVSF